VLEHEEWGAQGQRTVMARLPSGIPHVRDQHKYEAGNAAEGGARDGAREDERWAPRQKSERQRRARRSGRGQCRSTQCLEGAKGA